MEKEIRNCISELADLLEIVGECRWSADLKKLYKDKSSPLELWLVRVTRLFGGMGALNDLRLNNADDDRVKDELTSKLYDMASRYLNEIRGKDAND